MEVPESMERVYDGLRYTVKNSDCIADDLYWDGRNYERHGRNTFLYKTPGNRYFLVTLTMWEGERNELVPVTMEEAQEYYERILPEQNVPYEEAFPGVDVQPA